MRYAFLALCALMTMGCRQDMHDQPRYRLNAASDFWGDGRSARPAIPGTVPRGMNKSADPAYWTGKIGGKEIIEFPIPVTRELIERGQSRYNIYCTPCHGMTGYGDGVIVTRGLKNPPSYHTEAMRDTPVGHVFDVMTSGYGSMQSYAARIPVKDRWAIVAYVKALQQSQNVKVAELSPEEAQKVASGASAIKTEGKKEAAH